MIAKFKKYKLIIFILCLCLCPFLIIGIIHFGNFLFRVLGLNINPVGIDNIVWFSFFSSFIGGLCTLIAFILSNESNEKNLANTFDENKRHIKYQQVMLEIEQEQKIISKAIYSLKPLYLITFFNQFKNNTSNIEHLLFLLKETNELLEKHIALRTELELQSYIIDDCRSCKNFEKCSIGKIKKEFSTKFYEIHGQIYDVLSNLIALSDNSIINYNSEININRSKRILKKFFVSKKDRQNAKDMLSISLNNYTNVDKDFDNLQKNMAIIKDIHYKGTNVLIGLTKSYVVERQKRASEKLDGKSILTYIEDAEKAEMLRKEYEEKQKQILEKVENKQEV